METKMFELADKLSELRETKRFAEDELKVVKDDIDSTESQLAKIMITEETQSFNRAGVLFYLNTKIHASAVVDKKDELFAALRENGFGSLVYETVNANSLSAFTKEQMSDNEDEIPEWLTGLVSVYEKNAVGVRKSK